MDNLPAEIVDKLFKHVHELGYYHVMEELRHYRVNTRFRVSMSMVRDMFYSYNGILYPCININDITATPYDIVSLIKLI